MPQYTRRKILYELGIASASIAGMSMQGCCRRHPPSDLYVMLQGPWLLSIANDLYLRAATTKMDFHWYSYFNPHPNPWPPVPADNSSFGTPIFQATDSIDLSNGNLLHFDVKPNCDRLWSREKRRRLFDAMRDQAQGLFYTSEVYCPEVFDCSLKPLEIHLSYPDAVYAMGLRGDVNFNNLDYVEDKKVKQWPSAIVLRYRNWKSASFFGDNICSQTIVPGKTEIHRKFGISYLLQSPNASDHAKPPASPVSSACAADKPATKATPASSDAAQLMATEAAGNWASVMRLMKFKCEKVPNSIFPVCKDGQKSAPSDTVGDDV